MTVYERIGTWTMTYDVRRYLLYVKGVSEKGKSILTKAGVRVAFKFRARPSMNPNHACLPTLASPRGVGVRDGWSINQVLETRFIRLLKNMLKVPDLMRQYSKNGLPSIRKGFSSRHYIW